MPKRSFVAWAIVGLIAIVLAVWIVKPAHAFKGCIHDHKNDAGYEALHEHDEPVLGVFERVRLDTICSLETIEKHDGLVTAIFTVILTLSTIALWRSTSGLLKETSLLRRAADSQKEDTAKSIAEAARAANAMQDVAIGIAETVKTNKTVVENQRQYMTMQLRAYVFPSDAGLIDGMMLPVPEPQRKNEPGVMLNIRNSGHTPARRLVSWASVDVKEISDEDTLIVPQIVTTFPTNLASGGVMPKPLWHNRVLTDQEIEDIRTGIRAIYLWGRIEYLDCFDRPQFTNFRLRYMGIFPPPQGVIFKTCQNGNDAS
jgi:hypothetical protein